VSAWWPWLQHWCIRDEARLADLLPWRTPIHVRYPNLKGPLTLEQIIVVENVPYSDSVGNDK